MKKTFLISYDLVEGSDYDGLYQAIKGYKVWAKITESTWAIVTTEKSTEIRDKLLPYFEDGGRLIIVKSASAGAWRNVICSNEWLKKNL